ILVLEPSKSQWQRFPLVIASAKALGACDVGAFKVTVPAELQYPLLPEEKTTKRWCWGYRAKALNKAYRVEMSQTRQVLGRTSSTYSASTDEAFEQHEKLLSEDGLGGVFYRTDIPVETPNQRATNHLPPKSIIWPLEGNRLSMTKYSVPGLHWPYGYESGSKFGASFSDHVEHFGLFSISHLHEGRKVWRIIPPSAADAFVEKLKESDHEITWDCDQCVRHAGVFVPVSTLKEWRIPHTIIDQRASEIIITMPGAYHSGFSTGYTLAEAVNYADEDWRLDAHDVCRPPSCPDYIPTEVLALLGSGEEQ
ncbi:JmjC domain, hydroxylase-domain-containing protein, partial [Immersiella caudata]